MSEEITRNISKIVKGFDWNRVSWKDKEYLTSMVKDTIYTRSVKASGVPFQTKYPAAGDYALFNDQSTKEAYKKEFYNTGEQSSHFLFPHPKGRKYWLVWSYVKD
jgi:hypothetical protein